MDSTPTITDVERSVKDQLASHVQFGNKKLPNTTVIFNMTSATDCVALALGLCHVEDVPGRRYCYALHAERQWPHPLPYRRAQAKIWDKITAEEFAIGLLAIPKSKKAKLLRFNEAGDFRSQNDVDKAEEIGRLLATAGILAHAYTSRRDLSFKKLKYLNVIGSGFQAPGTRGEFRIVELEKELPAGYMKCPGSCYDCTACMEGKLVYTRKHGPGRPKKIKA